MQCPLIFLASSTQIEGQVLHWCHVYVACDHASRFPGASHRVTAVHVSLGYPYDHSVNSTHTIVCVVSEDMHNEPTAAKYNILYPKLLLRQCCCATVAKMNGWIPTLPGNGKPTKKPSRERYCCTSKPMEFEKTYISYSKYEPNHKKQGSCKVGRNNV